MLPLSEERVGQGVALLDLRRGVVVQDHVHAGETGSGGILLLTVEGDFHLLAMTGLRSDLQEQGSRSTGRIVSGGVISRSGMTDTQNLGDDAADFRRGVELPLALSTLGGEVPHEILVGITKQVVPIGAVLREIQSGILKDGDEIGDAIHHLLAAAQLVRIIEVRHVGEIILKG